MTLCLMLIILISGSWSSIILPCNKRRVLVTRGYATPATPKKKREDPKKTKKKIHPPVPPLLAPSPHPCCPTPHPHPPTPTGPPHPYSLSFLLDRKKGWLEGRTHPSFLWVLPSRQTEIKKDIHQTHTHTPCL
jgi:hypothetical protein